MLGLPEQAAGVFRRRPQHVLSGGHDRRAGALVILAGKNPGPHRRPAGWPGRWSWACWPLFLGFALSPLRAAPAGDDRPGEARRFLAASSGVSRPPSARFSGNRTSPCCCSSCCCTGSARPSSSRWSRRSCSTRARRAGWDSTTTQVGLVYGTVGVVALLLGGLLGGFVVSRQGLQVLAVADAAGHPSARRGVRLPGLRPADKPGGHQPAWPWSSSATASASPPTCCT